jgi:hypothetical protein
VTPGLHHESIFRVRLAAVEKEVVAAHGPFHLGQRFHFFPGGLAFPVKVESLAANVAISVWMTVLVLAEDSHRLALHRQPSLGIRTRLSDVLRRDRQIFRRGDPIPDKKALILWKSRP